MKTFIVKNIIVSVLLIILCLNIKAQNADFLLPDSLTVLLENNKKPDVKRMEALNSVIDVLFNELRYSEAYPYINEMGVLADNFNNDYFKSLNKYYSGSYLCIMNDFKKGFRDLSEAQNLSDLLPESDAKQILKIRIHLALSACYTECSMLSDAYNQLQQGLALNETYGNKNLQIKLENNLAAVYSNIHKLDESNMIYKTMLKSSSLFPKGSLYCNYNIANNFITMSQPDSALFYLKIAQQNIETEKDNLLITKKIGDVYRLKRDIEKSIQYYDLVVNSINNSELDYSDIFSSTTLNLAIIYFSLNNYDSTIYFADKSIEASKKCFNIENEFNAINIKVEALEQLNMIDEAHKYLKESIIIQDSINSMKNVNKLNELMLQQEIITIEKEYQHQQFIARLEQSKERMRFFAVIAILIGTVLVILLLLNRKRILLKNKQIKEEALSIELDSRNRELASNVVTLMKKNEIFTEIINKLLIIKDNAVKDETKTAIVKVTKEIEKTIEGKLLEDFEVRFKQVHGDFYDRLTQKYPDLSTNEIRLCSFLKLNLTSKEISSLTGQTIPSIAKARHRLRKKMNLEDDSINLSNYIMNI